MTVLSTALGACAGRPCVMTEAPLWKVLGRSCQALDRKVVGHQFVGSSLACAILVAAYGQEYDLNCPDEDSHI